MGATEKNESKGFGRQVPPTLEHVIIYFDQAGFGESQARKFYQYYEDVNWLRQNGTTIRNWKTKAQEWLWHIKLQKPYLRRKSMAK